MAQNYWASTGGSGVKTLINGKWVDQSSPEGQAHMRGVTGLIQKRAADQAKRTTDIERSKAMIELNDKSSAIASGISSARMSGASGAETRGMSRRVHRRRGPSAFAALGKLHAENTKTQAADVNKLFDQIQEDRTKSSPAFATSMLPAPKFKK